MRETAQIYYYFFMSKYLLDIEILHLQDTETRAFKLPSGDICSIEMWRLHWIWYERLHETRPDFETWISDRLERRAKELNSSLAEAFAIILKNVVRGEIEDGRDPLETRALKALRRSRQWRARQEKSQ